jgi:hypothetical protein
MALPDPLPLSRADQTAFNACGCEKVSVGSYLCEALWKVALNECFT